MARIIPTVGRVMHYRPGPADLIEHDGVQPLAAIVCYVWNDDMVNLVVFDRNGVPCPKTSVLIDGAGTSSYAEWMPYQVGQAAKYEKLEAEKSAAHAPIDPPTHAPPIEAAHG
jgi:hypothetical protein